MKAISSYEIEPLFFKIHCEIPKYKGESWFYPFMLVSIVFIEILYLTIVKTSVIFGERLDYKVSF